MRRLATDSEQGAHAHADRLIGASGEEALGRKLTEVVPELAGLVATALAGAQRLVQGQVTISRAGRDESASRPPRLGAVAANGGRPLSASSRTTPSE